MNKVIAVSAARALNVSKRAAIVAVAAASISLLSMSAYAQIEPPRQRVDFGDLDLTKDQDAQQLYRRLRTAASEVCSHFSDYKGAQMRVRRLKCEGMALTNAVEEIGHPSLTALHTSKAPMKFAQRKTKAVPNT